MKRSFLGLVMLLLASAGLASAQSGDSGGSPTPGLRPSSDLPPVAVSSAPAYGPADAPAAQAPPCRPDGEVGACSGGYWARAEYLLWWIKDGAAPPLVTTGPAGSAGILGQGGTTVLFGGSDVNPAERHGGRFTVGAWLDEDHCVGLEGSYFFLASASTGFSAFGDAVPGAQVLARPFFNVSRGAEDSELVASPGIVGGTVQVASSSQLQGAEANVVCTTEDGCDFGLLAGFRFLDLDEGLTVREDLLSAPLFGLPGSGFSIRDSFATSNDFYGGQLGVRGEWGSGRLSLDGVAKVALGLSHEDVDIRGATRIAPAGGTPVVQAGGLLALPTNIGHYHRDEFAFVPEVGFRVRYVLTRGIQIVGGYTFLYDSDVARPGDQIDRGINPTQLPTSFGGTLIGPPRPIAVVKSTDFWAQGLNLGVEFRY